MKILFVFSLLLWFRSSAQTVVFDREHLSIVNQNGFARISGELTHNLWAESIQRKLSDININLSSVVLVQDIILKSLTQVDQGLKSALAVKQIGELCSEIYSSSGDMIEVARSNPALLLFAESVANQAKNRGLKLLSEVSELVLKEGDNVLMDYEKRDALLKKIALELRVIRALVFSMEKSMYWAKVKGILKSVNPFQGFINRDQQLVNSILNQYQIIQP